MIAELNALEICHRYLRGMVRRSGVYVDATAGRGRDTELLCRLAGAAGVVYAFDIQREAVTATRARLEQAGLLPRARLIHGGHERMADHVPSAHGVVFNFGFLPGGDHSVFTRAETSLAALDAAAALLEPGGFLALTLYSGGPNGYAERDAVLSWLEALDQRRFTALVCRFANRKDDPPLFAAVEKHP